MWATPHTSSPSRVAGPRLTFSSWVVRRCGRAEQGQKQSAGGQKSGGKRGGVAPDSGGGGGTARAARRLLPAPPPLLDCPGALQPAAAHRALQHGMAGGCGCQRDARTLGAIVKGWGRQGQRSCRRAGGRGGLRRRQRAGTFACGPMQLAGCPRVSGPASGPAGRRRAHGAAPSLPAPPSGGWLARGRVRRGRGRRCPPV